MSRLLDDTLAVLNGLVGDYLAREKNGLATEMSFHHQGKPVVPGTRAFAEAYPNPTPRLAVFVHGVMCTETIWSYPDGGDYGQELARDLGFTPLYVRYNSGLPIVENGARLAQLLTVLMQHYPTHAPVEELLLIGYSMGGLVVRSACHFASLGKLDWLAQVKRAIYVGTPHFGAPAERVGRAVAKLLETIHDPYTRLIADLGNLRSAGVKDLGYADLTHDDRARTRPFLSLRDEEHPVPLLPSIHHHLVAGSLAMNAHIAGLFGDAVISLRSATHGSVYDAKTFAMEHERIKVFPGRSHIALAHDPDVYTQLKSWCMEPL